MAKKDQKQASEKRFKILVQIFLLASIVYLVFMLISWDKSTNYRDDSPTIDSLSSERLIEINKEALRDLNSDEKSLQDNFNLNRNIGIALWLATISIFIASKIHSSKVKNSKKCQYCAETIKSEATICRYCHREQNDTSNK